MQTRDSKALTVRPSAAIIIPAYNEANVIGRCLEALLRDSHDGEFQIIVVCNGCQDATERVARQFSPRVRVFAIEEASKTNALNVGDRMATVYPRVYLDSDLEVTTKAVRGLSAALESSDRPAAVGFMDLDLSRCSRLVKAFYRTWQAHPYLKRGKFGGIYALSRQGCEQRGPYPGIIADDTYARDRFRFEEVAAVTDCRFTVFPPRNLSGLFRIRTRAYLGNLQLKGRVLAESADRPSETKIWLANIARTPSAWIGVPIYVAVNLFAKVSAVLRYRRASFAWLRDETSRHPQQRVKPA